MKINDILQETDAFKSEQWSEGYDAFWNGKHPDDCPYKEEAERAQWINGWQYASREED